MLRKAVFLAVVSFASSTVLADQPAGIPDGAIPIDNPSEAAKAFQQESDTGEAFTETGHSSSQKRAFSATARSSAPGKAMNKVDVPSIKVRPVIADPKS